MKVDFALNRIAFFLIAILVFLVLVSAIIPQRDLAEEQVLDWKELLGDRYAIIETLALDRIYFTPFFFVVLALLGVNLALGNIRRFRLVYRVERTLLKARHIGSIVFHLSLLLIMMGVILNYLFKFDGVYALTEGQTVDDSHESYFMLFEGPLRREGSSRFDLRLEQVHETYQVEDSYTEAAEIAVSQPQSSPSTYTVRTNKPLKWNDIEFHFGLKTGYSPEVLVADSAGEQIFRGFVRLATQNVGREKLYADYVLVPSEGLRVNVKVLPQDSILYLVSVERGDSTILDGRLTMADTARFEQYELTIPRLRRWCYIDVVESPFLNLVFAGFWTGLAGLSVSLLPRVFGRRPRGES